MGMSIGKEVRLSYFLPPELRGTLLLDLSATASVGVLPRLENLETVLPQVARVADGIVLNPGPAEKFAEYLGGRETAASLVRIDWTNAYRPEDFALPVQHVHRVMISSAEDALAQGASGVVATFMMGFDDEFEAESIDAISHLARDCYSLSLPLVGEIRPIGPKITHVNHDGVVKLGVSFLMEAGVDALIVSPTAEDTRTLLGSWASIPVLERHDEVPAADDVEVLLDAGFRGVVLTEKALEAGESDRALMELREALRSREEVGRNWT